MTRRIRCRCGHFETKHVPKRMKMPAYCTACRGAKSLHEYAVEEAA